jgi:hypothetical protein
VRGLRGDIVSGSGRSKLTWKAHFKVGFFRCAWTDALLQAVKLDDEATGG